MPVEHKCHICQKVLTRSTILRDHLRSHEKTYAYGCKTCGRGFVRNSDRKAHEKIHTNDYQWRCHRMFADGTTSGCGAQFHRKSDWKRHMKRKANITDSRNSKCLLKHPSKTLTREESETINAMLTLSNSSTPVGRYFGSTNEQYLNISNFLSAGGSTDLISLDASQSIETSSSTSTPDLTSQASPELLSSTMSQQPDFNLLEDLQPLPRRESSPYLANTVAFSQLPPVTPRRPFVQRYNDTRASSGSSGEQNVNRFVLSPCTLCAETFNQAYLLRAHMQTHIDSRFTCKKSDEIVDDLNDHGHEDDLAPQEMKFICRGKLRTDPGKFWGCNTKFPDFVSLGQHWISDAGQICLKPFHSDTGPTPPSPAINVRATPQQQSSSIAPSITPSKLLQRGDPSSSSHCVPLCTPSELTDTAVYGDERLFPLARFNMWI